MHRHLPFMQHSQAPPPMPVTVDLTLTDDDEDYAVGQTVSTTGGEACAPGEKAFGRSSPCAPQCKPLSTPPHTFPEAVQPGSQGFILQSGSLEGTAGQDVHRRQPAAASNAPASLSADASCAGAGINGPGQSAAGGGRLRAAVDEPSQRHISISLDSDTDDDTLSWLLNPIRGSQQRDAEHATTTAAGALRCTRQQMDTAEPLIPPFTSTTGPRTAPPASPTLSKRAAVQAAGAPSQKKARTSPLQADDAAAACPFTQPEAAAPRSNVYDLLPKSNMCGSWPSSTVYDPKASPTPGSQPASQPVPQRSKSLGYHDANRDDADDAEWQQPGGSAADGGSSPSQAANDSPTPVKAKVRSTRMTAEEKVAAKEAKEAAKLEKQATKEAAKKQKKLDQENERARKAHYKEVQKASSGKHSSKFLVVQLSTNCFSPGCHLGSHLTTLLKEREMQCERVELPLQEWGRCVRWLQRVPRAAAAAFTESQVFEESQGQEQDETSVSVDLLYPHVLLILDADRWVQELMQQRLQKLLSALRSSHGDCSFAVLVPGLAKALNNLERKGPDVTFNQERVWDAMANALVNVPAGRFRWDLPTEIEAAEHIDVWSWALASAMTKQAEGYLKCFGEGKDGQELRNMQFDMGTKDDGTRAFWKALCALVDPGKAAAVANKYPSMAALMEALSNPLIRDDKARKALLMGLRVPGSSMCTASATAETLVNYFHYGTDPKEKLLKGKEAKAKAKAAKP